MSITKFRVAVLAPLLLVCAAPAQAQTREAMARNRAESVAKLRKQLLWHGEAGLKEYERTRDDVTQRLIRQIDGFVGESFQPDTAAADRVKAGVDALLGYKKGDLMKNVAFSVSLPGGHFLILGVELWRGAAIPENAVSFRAYKETENRFVLVASTDDLHSSNTDDPYLAGLHAEPLPSPPVAGEFWFLALSEVPPLTPYLVAMRLYAFDGKKFRTIWASKDMMAEGSEKAIELTSGGFVVRRLFDPTGMAAKSPTIVIHEQYVLTVEGPQKVAEWQTEYR